MKKNVTNLTLSIVNAIAYFAMIGFNFLVEYLPLNNVTSKDVSDSVQTIITPPGYVFSIWGVIYGLLFIFIVGQFFRWVREKPYFKKLSYAFIATCILNILWLAFFHYSAFFINLIIIVLFFIVLLYITDLVQCDKWTTWQVIVLILPFTIYMAWVSIATLANFAIVLTDLGLLSHPAVATLVGGVLLIVATYFILWWSHKYCNPYGLLVYIWAFMGIGSNYYGENTLLFALVCICLFILVYNFLRLLRTGPVMPHKR